MAASQTTTRTLPGDPPVTVLLRASSRARRITLRISSFDGRVTLTRPAGTPERVALAFAEDQADWLRERILGRGPPRSPKIGGTIPVRGEPTGIAPGPPGLGKGGVRIRPGRPAGPQVAAILKDLARARFATAVSVHAGALGVSPRRITLRDTRSRWGSCSDRGDLMFSWRLAMAPDEILDYVAAHEVSHLARMDHSPAFWAICARLCPDWRARRDWLRARGADLHAWRFDGED